MQRPGSSSRPVAHTSDVDFDAVPSPRASPSYTARKSLPHSRETLSLGRSRLSHSTVAPEEDDVDDGSDAGGAPDYGGYDDNFDDEDDVPQPVSRTPHRTPHRVQTPRRTSFAQMDQEAEEEAQVEDEMDFDRSPSAKARGKQRASFVSPPPPQYEDDMEPEIAQGFEDLEQEPDEEEDAEPPSMKAVQRKKGTEVATKTKERAKPREKPRPRKDIVLRERGCQIWCTFYSQVIIRSIAVSPDDPNTDGVRRSKRMRYSPLAWWRLEKVVYGRRENGASYVPSIKEIHRIPQIKPEPLGKKKRGGQRGKSRTVDEPEAQQVIVYDPEGGWDDETDPYCNVLEYGEDGKEVTRRK